MRRPRHGILADARAGREEAGHEIEGWVIRPARHHHAANRKRRETLEVGLEAAHDGFALHLDQVVEPVLGRVACRRAEGGQESRDGLARLRADRWKIQDDPITVALRSEGAAAGEKARGF